MMFRRKPKSEPEETFTDKEIKDMLSNNGTHRQACESLRDTRDKLVQEMHDTLDALKDRMRNGVYKNGQSRSEDLKRYRELREQVAQMERDTTIRVNPNLQTG